MVYSSFSLRKYDFIHIHQLCNRLYDFMLFYQSHNNLYLLRQGRARKCNPRLVGNKSLSPARANEARRLVAMVSASCFQGNRLNEQGWESSLGSWYDYSQSLHHYKTLLQPNILMTINMVVFWPHETINHNTFSIRKYKHLHTTHI